MKLKDRWNELMAACQVSPEQSGQLWAEVETHYSEPHRKYHNLQHLEELFSHFDAHQDQFSDPVAVSFAIWYHDIIYSVTDPSQNEANSAILAHQRMTGLNLEPKKCKKVREWILASKSHTLSPEWDDPDGRLFLDLDLAILGSDREKYRQYADNIRREYSVYPDEQFREGRKIALRHLLDQPGGIFSTELFQDKFEAIARKNLQQELSSLYP